MDLKQLKTSTAVLVFVWWQSIANGWRVAAIDSKLWNVVSSLQRRVSKTRFRDSSSAKSQRLADAINCFRGGDQYEVSPNDHFHVTNHARGTSWWHPWPFRGGGRPSNCGELSKTGDQLQSGAQLFLRYAIERGKIGASQISTIVGDAAYHLPPAGPPLILLALLPIGRPGLSIQASKLNIFARRLAFSSLSISALSWAHCELQKRERITPLPLPYHFSSPVPRDVRKAVLPPFLPEETMDKSIPWRGSILSDDITPTAIKPREDGAAQKNEIEITPPWRKKVSAWSVAPRSFAATYWEWSRMRRARQREIQHIRRNSIMGELIAYQKVRQLAEQNGESATLRWKQSNHTIREFNSSARDERSRPKMGWALVTGASRGIGRACAVELARWEIPVILVARDLTRLKSLAKDLEACYGIRCCVVRADLSQPSAPAELYSATRTAGLDVDILVNNAGLSSSHDFLETDSVKIEQIINLNAGATASLTRLYGKDMKIRRRGRILFVSSITGALPGVPGSAVYAASKAFQKSLALAVAKELEPHGVGVTCLLPGAVRGTAFAERGEMEEALCWKYPFYPKTAPQVASMGISAMLAGDDQAIPGWQNRGLVRVFQPMLPTRVTMLIAETSWKPLRFPGFLRKEKGRSAESKIVVGDESQPEKMEMDENALPPNVLVLESNADEPLDFDVEEQRKVDEGVLLDSFTNKSSTNEIERQNEAQAREEHGALDESNEMKAF